MYLDYLTGEVYTNCLDIFPVLCHIFGRLVSIRLFCYIASMWFVFLPALLAFPLGGYAQPLRLDYGVNMVDINADGVDDMIVRTRWENMNAHSFDRYLIAVTLNGPAYSGAKVYEVPLGDDSDYRIQTNEGADCLRAGFAFSLDGNRMLKVVKYRLEAGVETYCEPARMTTTTYRLRPNPDGGFGIPYFYLKQVRMKTSSQRYEDVSGFIQ